MDHGRGVRRFVARHRGRMVGFVFFDPMQDGGEVRSACVGLHVSMIFQISGSRITNGCSVNVDVL